jgi:acyl-CoA reductase-like NAD-dependent aldehyde dehydrogenase
MAHNLSDANIRAIVEQVVAEISLGKRQPVSYAQGVSSNGVFSDINSAVEAAHKAFIKFQSFGPQQRTKILAEVRRVVLENKELLSRMVYEETQMGRYEDKVLKHIFAATATPGVEQLPTHSWSGSNGLAVEEHAPFGVIGAILPSTHPSETMVNNSIMMLASGNTVVFNAHPAAKKVSAYTLQLLNATMVQAGAPENLIACVAEPTIESANQLFHHPKVRLLVVTGGPAVVKAAMQSAKKVIAAGPGNPPVIVDETADIDRAAERITKSAAFDNNVLCTAEKEVFVVGSVFEKFMTAMERNGNKRLSAAQIANLASKAFTPDKSGHLVVNRSLVGRNASVIAQEVGLSVSASTPLLFGETDRKHVFVQEEQLMPFMPVVRVNNFDEALEAALEAEHGFSHTASIFTCDMSRATTFARRANCSIFVINGGTSQGNGGGEGEGTLSFTIATPTGEAITRPTTFTRIRRIMTAGSMRFI